MKRVKPTAWASRQVWALAALLAGTGAPAGQESAQAQEFIAFRVDADHVMAAARVIDIPNQRQITAGLSPTPAACVDGPDQAHVR